MNKYNTVLVAPRRGVVQDMIEGLKRLFGLPTNTAPDALRTIEELSRPTETALKVGILCDDPAIVSECLDAGIEPKLEDLRLVVSPRCVARAGKERVFAYRSNVAELLQARLGSQPVLVEYFIAGAEAIERSAKVGNQVSVVGYRAMIGIMRADAAPLLQNVGVKLTENATEALATVRTTPAESLEREVEDGVPAPKRTVSV